MHRRRLITTAVAAAIAATTAFAPRAMAESTAADVDSGVITGRVTTPSGRPAAGVRVTVDDVAIARDWNTTTAADGRYRIEVPVGTTYVVSFTDGHLQQYSPRKLDIADARRYTVREGRRTHVSERLVRAATLTGRLVDDAGAPVAGASVRFIYTETVFELQTTTDADGYYRFAKLAPGPVKVAFRSPDGRAQYAYQKLTWDDADSFVLTLGKVTTVNDALLPS